MAHTETTTQRVQNGAMVWSATVLLCLGLMPLPYGTVIGVLGLVTLGLWQSYFYPKVLLSLLHRQGFIALGLLLIISACFANFPGEAFLQLAHFLPFFWFWAFLVIHLQKSYNPWQQIFLWAVVLVLTSFPINVIGISEFTLKHAFSLEVLSRFHWVHWFYTGDLDHPRTFSLFDYPNTLANYLVMMLGLNIGLMGLRLDRHSFGQLAPWCRYLLILNIPITLVCLYCSGSRNGYLVAAILLLIGLFTVRTYRWVKALGLAGLVLIVGTTLKFGIGGRSLSWSWLTDDPRVGVWQLALQMIRDRPLLGQGLGNYKLLYNGEVPGYDFIAHAHNLWLMLGAEAGLPLMIGFTVSIGYICFRGVKGLLVLKEHPNHWAVLFSYHLCFLGAVLFSLFDVTLFEVRVNLVGWLSLVVLYLSPELSQDCDPQG